ncbi:hypothetical protein GEMRC1_010419 [Eukaryota sp. GEM-RC1]
MGLKRVVNVSPAAFEVISTLDVDCLWLTESLKHSWENNKVKWTGQQFDNCLKGIKCDVTNIVSIFKILSELVDDSEVEFYLCRHLIRLMPLLNQVLWSINDESDSPSSEVESSVSFIDQPRLPARDKQGSIINNQQSEIEICRQLISSKDAEFKAKRELVHNISTEINRLSTKQDSLSSSVPVIQQEIVSLTGQVSSQVYLDVNDVWPHPADQRQTALRFLQRSSRGNVQTAERFLQDLDQMKAQKRFRQPVFGPLGCFFEADRHYVAPVSHYMGRFAMRFLTTNSHDLALLKKLMTSAFGRNRPDAFCFPYDGEPPISKLDRDFLILSEQDVGISRVCDAVRFVYFDQLHLLPQLIPIYNKYIEFGVTTMAVAFNDDALDRFVARTTENQRLGRISVLSQKTRTDKVRSGDCQSTPIHGVPVLLNIAADTSQDDIRKEERVKRLTQEVNKSEMEISNIDLNLESLFSRRKGCNDDI